MNAESTVFRASRPAVVVAPGAEGARAAAWLLAWPVRLAATPLGRRLLAALALAIVMVASVGWLYDSADQPRVAATFRAAGGVTTGEAGGAAAGGAGRQQAAAPVRAKAPAKPAEVAAAWWAARHKLPVDKVKALQQRRVSATEVQVLVMAETAGLGMPSDYVTVRKGSSGWKVP
jgi:hypothetical protein